MCDDVEAHSLQRFAVSAELERTIGAMDARDRCERHCLAEDKCWGCSAHCATMAYGFVDIGTDCAWHAVSSCDTRKRTMQGFVTGDVTRKNGDGGQVSITVSGPADVWFGFG